MRQAVDLSQAQSWLDAVQVEHPAIVAASLRLQAAQSRAEGARGVFDFNLAAKGGLTPLGKYDEANASLGFEQPTPLWGFKIGGGYRVGEDYPTYKGGNVTGSGGELYLDLLLPLWKDRDIDSRRFKVANADIKRDGERIKADMKALEVSVKAVSAFWVAVERQWELRIAERLLELATVREAQVDGRIRTGQLAEISRVDNLRLVLDRRGKVAKARAAVAKALADLKVFFIEATGVPELPTALPTVDVPLVAVRAAMRKSAIADRPDMALWGQLRAQLELQLRAADNAKNPKLDVKMWARQDVGDKRSLGLGQQTVMATEVGVGLEFGLPVQQREADGEIAAISAELRALAEDLKLATLTLDAGFDGIFAEIDALAEMARFAEGAYQAAIVLAQAERRAFDLGQSTLVIVNVREEATASAAMSLVDARLDLIIATAKAQAFAGRRPRLMPE